MSPKWETRNLNKRTKGVPPTAKFSAFTLRTCSGIKGLACKLTLVFADIFLATGARFNQAFTLGCVFGFCIITCCLYHLCQLFAICCSKEEEEEEGVVKNLSSLLVSARQTQAIEVNMTHVVSATHSKCTELKGTAFRHSDRSMRFDTWLEWLKFDCVSSSCQCFPNAKLPAINKC